MKWIGETIEGVLVKVRILAGEREETRQPKTYDYS
jgi:hypothetical protein